MMRAIDICRMALKNLRGKWLLAPLACLIASTVCLCYAGAISVSVHAEKRKPCELTATAPYGRITDQSVADMGQIPDVTVATAVLPVQTVLTAGRYTATITLLGIDGQYLTGQYAMGSVFSGDSPMPHIVLNEAAAKRFIDPDDPPSTSDTAYVPDIDWLHAGIALYPDGDIEAKPFTAKVSGILSGNGDTESAAGYIGISAAKALLKNRDMPTGYAYALVRVIDMGAAEDVTRQIRSLGYIVEHADPELQAKWDGLEKERTYLLWMGILSLVYGVLFMASIQRIMISEQQDEIDMLRWIGMAQSVINQMVYWQAGATGIIGAVLGLFASYLIPAFISVEQKGASNFALPIPPLVALSVVVVCISISILPAIFVVKKQLIREWYSRNIN